MLAVHLYRGILREFFLTTGLVDFSVGRCWWHDNILVVFDPSPHVLKLVVVTVRTVFLILAFGC